MRRLGLIGVLVLVVQLVPSPADAWFGYLARLSGPGEFKGLHFEMRLYCFGERVLSPDARRAQEEIDAALKNKARLLGEEEQARFIANLNTVRLTLDPTQAPFDPSAKRTVQELETLATEQKALAERHTSMIVAGAAVGAGVSMCSTHLETIKRRTGSFDLGTSVLRTDRDPEYASNERITLVKLVPAFTVRVFKDVRHDFVDVGTGAGVFWLSSPGFQSVDGVVLEPVRVDLHAPSIIASRGWWGQAAASVNFRVSWVTFPGGFEADAFNAIGSKAVRLPAELVRSYTLTANLQTLFFGFK